MRPASRSSGEGSETLGRIVAGALVALALVLHAASSGRLDFFRDELYFIVCGSRPDFGYVDQPPLVPLLAHASYVLAGGVPGAFRIVPALAHAATVAAAIALAAALGGRTYARAFAGLAVAVAPVYASFGWLFTTNIFDPLAWTLVALGVVLAARNERFWLLAGAALGIALEAKYGLAFYLPGLVVGLGIADRCALQSRWFYAGAALAAGLAAPSIVWQAAHGFPMAELLVAGARGGKNVPVPFVQFVLAQGAMLGPAAAAVVLAGLARALAGRDGRAARALAIGWTITLAVLMALHAKDYYFAAAHPALIAVGAAATERFVRSRAARGALLAVAAAYAVVLPAAIPIGGAAGQVAFERLTGRKHAAAERAQRSRLSSDFADTFGWRDLARAVDAAWSNVPISERTHAVVFVQNYGDASAIALFATAPGLHVIATHNQYWLWGPAPWDGRIALLLRRAGDVDANACASLRDLGPVRVSPEAMSYERTHRLYLCRGVRAPVTAIWSREKYYW